MSLPPFDLAAFHAALAPYGAAAALGAGDDPDEAFDYATGNAAGPGAALLLAADPAELRTFGLNQDQDLATVWSVDQVAGHALAWLRDRDEHSPTVAAWPIAARSAHTRRTVRARVEVPELEVDSTGAARWLPPTPAVAAALADVVEPGALDGALEQTSFSRRARYRTLVERFTGKAAHSFAVFDGDVIVSGGHPTAGVAGRAGRDLLKAMDKDDHTLKVLEVRKVSGREGGNPLQRVSRARHTQVLQYKLTFAEPKKASGAKVVGWLIVVAPAVVAAAADSSTAVEAGVEESTSADET